jgi:hypothetical protein
MIQRVCSNQDCHAIYTVEDEKVDDGVCSFDCFEKMFCHEPTHEKFEKIEVA